MVRGFGVSALAFLIACASNDELTGASEQNDTLHPQGDETMGSLLVTAPPGVTLSAGGLDFSVSINGTAVPVGTETRVKAGRQCLHLSTKRWHGGPATEFTQTISDCSLTIVAGQTTTYALSGLRVTYDDARLTRTYGVRPYAGVFQYQSPSDPAISDTNVFGEDDLMAGPAAEVGPHPASWTFRHASGAAEVVPVVAGHYRTHFAVANIAGSSTDVAQGQIVDWDITPSEWRQAIRFDSPRREFGDPPGHPHCGRTPGYVIEADRSMWNDRDDSAPFANVGSPTRWLAPADAGGKAVTYTLSIYGITQSLSATAGGMTNITPHRIDVDDVELTTETGETRKVPGTYTVGIVDAAGVERPHPFRAYDQADFNGGHPICRERSEFPTKTGIDVLPGSYVVHVRWVDGAGTKTRDLPVTF
jgi:hypothetical protein